MVIEWMDGHYKMTEMQCQMGNLNLEEPDFIFDK